MRRTVFFPQHWQHLSAFLWTMSIPVTPLSTPQCKSACPPTGRAASQCTVCVCACSLKTLHHVRCTSIDENFTYTDLCVRGRNEELICIIKLQHLENRKYIRKYTRNEWISICYMLQWYVCLRECVFGSAGHCSTCLPVCLSHSCGWVTLLCSFLLLWVCVAYNVFQAAVWWPGDTLLLTGVHLKIHQGAWACRLFVVWHFFKMWG